MNRSLLPGPAALRARGAFRLAAVLPGAALALAFALPAMGADAAAASASRGAPVVSSAEEKQRQPKTPREEPKTKSKPPGSRPEEPSSSDNGDSDSNDVGFWASCIGDCFTACAEGAFDGMVNAMFGGGKSKQALTDSTAALGADPNWEAAPYVPHDWAKLDVGYLRANSPGDSVALRRSPSNPDSMMLVAGTLPDGARVLVTDTHEGSWGSLVRVRAVDEQGPEGWVEAKSLRQDPNAPPMQDEVLAADSLGGTASAAAATGPTRWAIASTIGFHKIDNPLLATEYEYGGPVFELEYLRWFGSSPVAGLGVGFRNATGYPKVEYAGATEVDVPRTSGFEMWHAMLEFGQHLAWSSPFRLGYMFGPVVAHVHEEAQMDVLDAGTRVKIGERQEALNRWTWGGGGILWLGWETKPTHEVSLRFRMFGLAWDGRGEKSLTSDYTEEALLHYDVAFTYTHSHR